MKPHRSCRRRWPAAGRCRGHAVRRDGEEAGREARRAGGRRTTPTPCSCASARTRSPAARSPSASPEIPEQYRDQLPDGRRARCSCCSAWSRSASGCRTPRRTACPSRPDIQRQLASQRRDLLVRTLGERADGGEPRARAIPRRRCTTTRTTSDFKTPANVSLRHIQLKTEAEAPQGARAREGEGRRLEQAGDCSTPPTRSRADNGGNLGSVTRDGAFAALGTQPALAESAMALGRGRHRRAVPFPQGLERVQGGHLPRRRRRAPSTRCAASSSAR